MIDLNVSEGVFIISKGVLRIPKYTRGYLKVFRVCSTLRGPKSVLAVYKGVYKGFYRVSEGAGQVYKYASRGFRVYWRCFEGI